MTTEERQIIEFVKLSPTAFFSRREIARKAGSKRQFAENPEWPRPYLARLAEKKVLEEDDTGHYRLKPPEEDTNTRKKLALAPHIAAILQKTGKDYTNHAFDLDAPSEPARSSEEQGKKDDTR